MLSARAERAYNKGALRSLPLPFFPRALPSSNFHFLGETTCLSPPPILPSRSLLVRRCVWFSFSLRDHRCFTPNSLSLPPRHPSSPRPTLVRSEPLRLHAGQKRTLVQRVTNTRFFSLFFSERKYPLFGMERAHAFPGNSGKGGRREKEGETQYKKTR